jgi:hypothetical protein
MESKGSLLASQLPKSPIKRESKHNLALLTLKRAPNCSIISGFMQMRLFWRPKKQAARGGRNIHTLEN